MNSSFSSTAELSRGTIAYDVHGEGPPVVLVHGTPTSSYLWRNIVPVLSKAFTVYVYDLLGYGRSAAPLSADVSMAAQSALLAELLDHWGLQAPGIAGHDIGAGIVLRAHLLERRSFSSIALLDGVVFAPWITPTTRHIQANLDAYRTMPGHIYRQIVATHLRSAVRETLHEDVISAYLEQWTSEAGQAAYLRKVSLFDESQTVEIEARLGEVRVPVQIVWGEQDRWLSVDQAVRLAREIPDARLHVVPDAGHFIMEDAPDRVAEILHHFFHGASHPRDR